MDRYGYALEEADGTAPVCSVIDSFTGETVHQFAGPVNIILEQARGKVADLNAAEEESPVE